MAEIIDLDIIVPQVKKVKLNGKIIDCYPIKLIQLAKLAKLEQEMATITNPVEMIEKLKDTLSPIIPAIKEDPDFDITPEQLRVLVSYVQSNAVPDELKKVKEENDPKKKSSSPEV